MSKIFEDWQKNFDTAAEVMRDLAVDEGVVLLSENLSPSFKAVTKNKMQKLAEASASISWMKHFIGRLELDGHIDPVMMALAVSQPLQSESHSKSYFAHNANQMLNFSHAEITNYKKHDALFCKSPLDDVLESLPQADAVISAVYNQQKLEDLQEIESIAAFYAVRDVFKDIETEWGGSTVHLNVYTMQKDLLAAPFRQRNFVEIAEKRGGVPNDVYSREAFDWTVFQWEKAPLIDVPLSDSLIDPQKQNDVFSPLEALRLKKKNLREKTLHSDKPFPKLHFN